MFEPVSAIGFQLGFSALYALARPGSAVSQTAQNMRSVATSAVDAVERSRALFGEKASVISRIWEISNECGEPGWDGDNAVPISRLAVFNAIAVIRALPSGVPLPEIAPEPDGAVSLDWLRSRQQMFSLSAGENDRIAYAWLDGTDKGHGVARFDGLCVPQRILDGIRATMSHDYPAVRSS